MSIATEVLVQDLKKRVERLEAHIGLLLQERDSPPVPPSSDVPRGTHDKSRPQKR